MFLEVTGGFSRIRLLRAQAALAVAVTYGRIRLNRDNGDERGDD